MPLQPSSPDPAREWHIEPLRIEVSQPDPDSVVITPAGEADLCTVPALRRALNEVLAPRRQVIVDLDQLTFMDASVLRVLLGARERLASAGGSLQVHCRKPGPNRLLAITGLGDLLDSRP